MLLKAVIRQPSAVSRRRMPIMAAPIRPLWVRRRAIFLPLIANGKFILGDTGKFQHHGTAGTFDTCEECCGCPDSVTLTLAGIDGNGCMCAGPFSGLYRTYTLAGIDGSYNLPFISETSGLPNDWCSYGTSFTGTGYAIRTRYTDAACTSVFDTVDQNGYTLGVGIWKDNGQIRHIYVGGSQMEIFCSASGGFNSFNAYPGLALSTNHANANQAVPCVWFSASGTGRVD